MATQANVNLYQMNRWSKHLTMALTARDLAPRIRIENRQVLFTTDCERVVEIGFERSGLLPSKARIPEEHAEEVARAACLFIAIGRTCVENTQVVDELDITLLAIKLCGEFSSESIDSSEGMQLFLGNGRHACVTLDSRATEERCFD